MNLGLAPLAEILERVEGMVASVAVGGHVRESLSMIVRAHEALGKASHPNEAATALTLLGSRSLAAALDLSLEKKGRDVDGETGRLRGLLLQLSSTSLDAEEHQLAGRPSADTAGASAPALPLEDFPLTRCAAICASIARRKPERAKILETNGLEPGTWTELEIHWARAISDELRRGRTALSRAYDEAYVAQIEAERGPVLVGEYARLVIAGERGGETDLLSALDLPVGAVARLKRIWLRKMLDDKQLARQIRDALATA